MPPEPRDYLEFWRNLSRLREELAGDDALQAALLDRPTEVLRERNLDIEVTVVEGNDVSQRLSELLAEMDDPTRDATIDSLLKLSDRPGVEQMVVAPVNANANINVNVNANANANVNANVNVNTNGAQLQSLDASILPSRIVVPDGFAETAVGHRLSELHLNPVRQRALLKRALADNSSVISRDFTENTERRVSRYDFRGMQIEVEAVVENDIYTVTRAEFL